MAIRVQRDVRRSWKRKLLAVIFIVGREQYLDPLKSIRTAPWIDACCGLTRSLSALRGLAVMNTSKVSVLLPELKPL
jgi:hypothetical protein